MPNKTRLTKRFIAHFLIAALLAALGAYTYYTNEVEHHKTITIENELISLERSKASMSNQFGSIISDLKILASINELKEALDKNNPAAWDHLANDYKIIFREKKIYDQIRFIDSSGMEKLRINNTPDHPITVPPDKLQNKQHRYYFTDAIILSEDDYFISPLDLNIEHKKIELPIKPMIRFAMPVFDSGGKKRGIIIVNYLAQYLLDSFDLAHNDPLSIPSVGDVMLLNQQGYWLHADEPDNNWGFMYPERQNLTFGSKFPHEWDVINSNIQGTVETESGIFIYSRSHPYLNLITKKGSGRHEHHKINWVVLSHISKSTIANLEQQLRQETLWIFIVTLLILASFIILLFRYNLIQQRLSEKDMKTAIQDAALDVIITCDDHGIIFDVNPAAEDVFLTSKDELIGRSFHDFVITTGFDLDRSIQEGVTEVEAMKSDGTLFAAEICLSRINYGEFAGYTCFLRDIEVRKKLFEEHEKLSKAVEHAGEAILLTDCEGIIEYVNPALEKVSGYSADELIGQSPSILKSGEHSESYYKLLWDTITSGKVWTGSIIDRKKDGSLYPARLTISPIINEEGKITHFVAIQEDMTQWEELENRFRQAQKMEAIGTLVGGIAHDFNNMLAGIIGKVFLAKKLAEPIPELATHLDEIEELGFSAADMIKQLLTFARKGQVEMRMFDIKPFIKETLKLVRTGLPETIFVNEKICAENLPILGDATQVQQIVMNLMTNARDAVNSQQSPEITASLELFRADKAFSKAHDLQLDSPFAKLSVSDNGMGIGQEHREHIFEPFFTTKEIGQGTGLGLSMVYGSVQSHNGIIVVDSELHHGTTVTIYLPLITSADPTDESKGSQEPVCGHGETLLLVDDQESVIQICQSILENLNYKVITAMNGKDALLKISTHDGEISLILMDVVMPVMGGIEAAREMERIGIDIPVLFVSGYTNDSSSPDTEFDKLATGFIGKPYQIGVLSRKIENLIKKT
ncbi:MAG: PAS domain S-box protein [Mariprofundaceae bacterium]